MLNNLNEKALTLISRVKTDYPGRVFEHLPPLEEAVRAKTVTAPLIKKLNDEAKEAEQDARKSTAEQARALIAEIKADPRYAAGKSPKLDSSINAAEKRLAIIAALNGANITATQAVTNLEIIKEQWQKTTGDATQIDVDTAVLEEAYGLYSDIQRYGPPPKGQYPAFDKPYTMFSKAFVGLKFDSTTGKHVSGKFTKATQDALKVVPVVRETWASVLLTYKESFLKNFNIVKDKWRETIESDDDCKQWVSKLEELYPLVGEGDQEALANACSLMTRLQERHVTKAQPQQEATKTAERKQKLEEIKVLERALEKKIGVKKYDSIYKFKYGDPIEHTYDKYVKKKNPIYEEQFFKNLDTAKKFLESRLNKPESPPASASLISEEEGAKYTMKDDNDDDEDDEDDEEEDEDEEDDYESSFIDDDRPHIRFHKKNGEKRPRTPDMDWDELAQVASVATENTWKKFKEEEDKSLNVLKKLVKDQGKRYKILFISKSGEEILEEDREAPHREIIIKWASEILQQYRQSTQDETNEITFRIVEEEENKQNI
jgi:hypothetical protein